MNRTHKFNATPVTIDGLYFDSTAEGARYCQLKLLQRAGAIRNLQVHREFNLVVDGVLICRYESDFTYTENGMFIVEDVKGFKTEVYKIKKKLMLACHGIIVLETSARK